MGDAEELTDSNSMASESCWEKSETEQAKVMHSSVMKALERPSPPPEPPPSSLHTLVFAASQELAQRFLFDR